MLLFISKVFCEFVNGWWLFCMRFVVGLMWLEWELINFCLVILLVLVVIFFVEILIVFIVEREELVIGLVVLRCRWLVMNLMVLYGVMLFFLIGLLSLDLLFVLILILIWIMFVNLSYLCVVWKGWCVLIIVLKIVLLFWLELGCKVFMCCNVFRWWMFVKLFLLIEDKNVLNEFLLILVMSVLLVFVGMIMWLRIFWLSVFFLMSCILWWLMF